MRASGKPSASSPCRPMTLIDATSPRGMIAAQRNVAVRGKGETMIRNAAPPVPKNRATNISALMAQSNCAGPGSASTTRPGFPSLGAPTENTTAPEMGCPSAEMARQLTTRVPVPCIGGSRISSTGPDTEKSSISRAPPPRSTRLAASGETASLNRSSIRAGASSTTAPLGGAEAIRKACAWAGLAQAITTRVESKYTASRTMALLAVRSTKFGAELKVWV